MIEVQEMLQRILAHFGGEKIGCREIIVTRSKNRCTGLYRLKNGKWETFATKEIS